MAKYASDAVLDGSLNIIKNNAAQMIACSTQPTTYNEANVTYKLAATAVTSTDFTVADDTSGRKVTVAAKTGVNVASSGTYQHVAYVSADALLYVTTGTSQVLTAGNTVDFPQWKVNLQDPS